MEQKYVGVLPDNRGDIDQKKDFQHEELFKSGDITWLTKKEADKAEGLFPERDQKSTSACVCYSVVTALYNTEKEILSPGFLYTQRINKPQEGSLYYDIARLVVAQGVPLEKDFKTPLKEKEINSLIVTPEVQKLGSPYRQKSYIFLNDPSIDDLAALSNNGIAVAVSIFANYKEWAVDYPIIQDPAMTIMTATINHSIAILPNTGFKMGGLKHVKIQDSAHFGNIIYRDLNESFVNKRLKHGMYFIDLEYAPTEFPLQLRGYTWNHDLTVGSRGEEVKRLQEFLIYKGFFPKVQEPTGYFGGITRQAVKDYQTLKKISPNQGYLGPITRAEINKETY